MKKIFTTLSIALLSAVTAFAAGPEIAFDEKSYDFGTIAEDGGGVTHEFKFTNSGDEPLLIINAKASCGCTRPTYPKKPIKPGKSDKIRVTYNPAGRPGEFVKTVTIKTNIGKKKEYKLKIKGTVTPMK